MPLLDNPSDSILQYEFPVKSFIQIKDAQAAFAMIESDNPQAQFQNATISVTSIGFFYIWDNQLTTSLELENIIDVGTPINP